MKIRYSLLCMAAILVLVSCKKKEETPARLRVSQSSVQKTYAQISLPAEVDMGTFQGSEMKKTVDIRIENVGNDSLYITHLSPECECTEVSVTDSIIAPGSTTQLRATLDLSGYPADTIRKQFSIISNSQKDHVATVTLKGEVK